VECAADLGHVTESCTAYCVDRDWENIRETHAW